MENLKKLIELRDQLKSKEKKLSYDAYLLNDKDAELKRLITRKKRKNIEKKIFLIIPNL